MKHFYILLLLLSSYVKASDHSIILAPSASISGTTTVCQNTTNPLVTFTGSGGTAPYTFTYSINSGAPISVSTIGNNSSISVTVSTSISIGFTYSLISVSDSTVPLTTVVASGSIIVTIKPQPDATLNGTGSGSTFGGIPVFKICNNAVSTFTFSNGSTTANTLNTSYSITWGDGSTDFSSASWTTPISHTYQVGLWNLSYTIQSTNGCNITENYLVFVGSNPAVSLGNPGNTDICNSSQLTFPITGATTNPPGTTYRVSFNDGSPPQLFSHPPPATVTHTFSSTSCGVSSSNGTTTFQNSFSGNIVAENPCGTSAVGVVPIYVSTPPVADFTLPEISCTNALVCIENTSIGAFENFGNSSSCSSSPKYIWSISPSTGFTLSSGSFGNDFGSNDPSLWTTGESPLCVNFFQAGIYTVTIKIANRCGFDIKVKTICIEPPLTPLFSLSSNSGCIPLSITTTNITVPTAPCNPSIYTWDVSYSSANCGLVSGYSYTNGTSSISTSPSFNFTEPGTYSITLTATNSCTPSLTTTQTVIVKKPPTVSIAPIANTCGLATINPIATVNTCAPSSSVIAYNWSFPGGTPASATTLNPGIISYPAATTPYTVTFSATNECGVSTTATQLFSVSPIPVVITTPLTQTICSGIETTPINLTANSTGTTFSWSATASQGISGFTASGTGTVIPAQIITTTNVVAGTVTYSITPFSSGCSGATAVYTITVNPAPIISQQPTFSAVCQGASPSLLTVILNNTSGNPTYQWYSNSVDDTSSGTLISGATTTDYAPPSSIVGTTYYYCVVTLNSGGCSTIVSATALVAIAPLASISQLITTQSICLGSTISTALFVTSSGGTGTPSYQWYFNTTNSNIGGTLLSGATNASYLPITFNSTGTFYYYVAINYINGCGNFTSSTAEIIVVDDPTIIAQPLAMQTLCQNTIATNLTVIPSGGIGSIYSYQWYSNTVNNTSTGTLITGEITDTFIPSTAVVGTFYYYCIIEQLIGTDCTVTSSIARITVTLAPGFTNTLVSSSICLGQTPAQLVIVTNSDSLLPTYQWYSNVTNSNTGGILLLGELNATFNPLSTFAGTMYYYCVVSFPTLIGNCSVITSSPAEVIINQNPLIFSETTIICSATSFTITPTNTNGNSIPIGTTYTWTNPIISPAGSINGASAEASPQNIISQTLLNTTTNPATVIYTVTPTSGACVGNSFIVTVTVNPAINPNVVVTNNSCFGVSNASITTNVTGGIPPYNLTWIGPNGFTSTATSIFNLEPGNYNVTVNDVGNCPFTNSYSITEPSDIVITTDTNTNVNCFGASNGSIAITVSGGTGVYSYSWTKDTFPFASIDDISNLAPGTYVVSVLDANNCGPKTATFIITQPLVLALNLVNQTNVDCYGFSTGSINIDVVGGTLPYIYAWSNGATTEDLTTIPAGVYELIVTDSLGCIKNISVTITQSPEILIAAITTPIACYGDNNATISVTLSGGIPPYQYQWSNLANTLNQSNLSPDNYNITVIDNLGCQKNLSITIASPPIFEVTPVVSNISCFGANDGSINLNFVGGVIPINLVWSDGSTAGTTRNNLPAGTYSVMITDSKPCTINRTFIIVEPQPLTLTATVTNPLDCSNGLSGAIDLIPAGGLPPYTFLWSNGTTTEDLSAITAGVYSISVTDSNGCVKNSSYSLIRPLPLIVSVTTITDFDCTTREVSQSFVAQASGGVPPYLYQWSSGVTSGVNNEIMTTIINGAVQLTVTDSQSCITTYTVIVNNLEIGNAFFEQTSIGFATYGIYSISDPIQFTTTATGDIVSIAWDFGDGTFSTELNPVHTYVNASDYVVTQTVTYPFGCVYQQTLTLLVEKGYVLVVPTAFTPNNDSINDTFKPVTKALKNVRLDVYDTWGSIIYSETGEVLSGWDAKINGLYAENGNYYCKVSAETFYGTNVNENHPFTLLK